MLSAGCFNSSISIALMNVLNSSKFSAEIRVPAFVNPVYCSDLANSRIVTPLRPLKSSTLITMSVSGFRGTLPMSFSIFRDILVCLYKFVLFLERFHLWELYLSLLID